VTANSWYTKRRHVGHFAADGREIELETHRLLFFIPMMFGFIFNYTNDVKLTVIFA